MRCNVYLFLLNSIVYTISIINIKFRSLTSTSTSAKIQNVINKTSKNTSIKKPSTLDLNNFDKVDFKHEFFYVALEKLIGQM